MIRIDISKPLAKPLAAHIGPAKQGLPSLAWRADVAMIGAQPCVVAEEQFSRYVMVLCDLGKEDFLRFPELFRERFCSELAAICGQADLHNKQTLFVELNRLCEPQHFQLDPEPLEEGRISKTIDRLERRLVLDKQPLPVDGRAAFEFTFPINAGRKGRDKGNEAPNAAEILGNLCLKMIERQLESRQPEALIVSEVENVVRVDFARQRNR